MLLALNTVPAQGVKPSTPSIATQTDVAKAGKGPEAPKPTAAARPSYGPATIVETSPTAKSASTETKPRDPEQLSEDEERQVQKLRQRDTEVRAHEGAHSAAGGGLAGGASYEYTTGPDGRRYAVGGEVQIDASPVRDNPAATIAKMDIVIRAALAPADPSPQDRSVATAASKARSEAQAQLRQQTEAQNGASEPAGAPVEAETKPGAPADTPAASRLAAARAYGDQPPNIQDVAASIFGAAAQLA